MRHVRFGHVNILVPEIASEINVSSLARVMHTKGLVVLTESIVGCVSDLWEHMLLSCLLIL